VVSCPPSIPASRSSGLSPLAQSLPTLNFHALPSIKDQPIALNIQGTQVTLSDSNKIGQGGMAAVYKVFADGRELAAKYTSIPKLAAFLRKEGVFGSQLNSAPGFHQVYGVADAGGGAVLLMDFIPGEKASRLAGILPQATVIRCIRDISLRLYEAHLQGIIHRDIKTENIMIEIENGRHVKSSLFDFGLATTVDEQRRQSGLMVGTPAFFSPEQARGQALDPRSDLYSLGVVFYEMLTGRNPIDPRNDMPAYDLINSVALGTVAPDLTKLPVELRPIIGKMLERNRETRYQDCLAVFLDLATVLENMGLDPNS
jgi:serine/threonine protein kinase